MYKIILLMALSYPAEDSQKLINDAITITSNRKLIIGVHTPWQIVHGAFALGEEFTLLSPDGKEINGIKWLKEGATYHNVSLFERTQYGARGRPFTKPFEFEGHPTQFMGYMLTAKLPKNAEIKTDRGSVIVADIIHDAQMQIVEGPEIAWTLMFLNYYLDADSHWKNARGEPWSIEKMIRIQIGEEVTRSACGGCHGLYALSLCVSKYYDQNKRLDGIWTEAYQKVRKYVAIAKVFQNPDGSFSPEFFATSGYSQDLKDRLPPDGHILEWLMVTLNDEEIKAPWIEKAAKATAQDLIRGKNDRLDVGAMYHGLHALIMYRKRIK